jgi:murein DD-endopeptidase MepM/ murein hydrolase activator NlpD
MNRPLLTLAALLGPFVGFIAGAWLDPWDAIDEDPIPTEVTVEGIDTAAIDSALNVAAGATGDDTSAFDHPEIDGPTEGSGLPGDSDRVELPSVPPPDRLMIPVAGIRAEQLVDTYADARSEGRVHNAIDIAAPEGTPVLAAADGTIVKLFESVKGGTTLYIRGRDGVTIYYYAHLQRYADGVTEGMPVRRGDLIGHVGNSGNAGPDNHHLHFAIWTVDDPTRYWDGASINPYPLLVK